jgi:hypothetical protein
MALRACFLGVSKHETPGPENGAFKRKFLSRLSKLLGRANVSDLIEFIDLSLKWFNN